VTEYAHGFRGIPEALFLRDHITRQVEMADTATDPAERDARLTFVVVGAGYTGTEVAAQGVLYTEAITRHRENLRGRVRWLLIDTADRVLPQLDIRLARASDRVLRERGVEVRLKDSVKEATADGVHLSDGDFVPTKALIWCVGVRPDPLIDSLGLQTKQGRLVVDEFLTVPQYPDVYAIGDAAAVPDLTRPGEITGMTAQHATRQGTTAAKNIAASYGRGRRRPYKHHDLGFVVDLGGLDSAANPLGVPLSGPIAKAVTRGYHLLSMPGNRVRVAADWLLDLLLPRQGVQLGLVPPNAVPLDSANPDGPPATGFSARKAP
jgi:NADH dehydrogenase